MVADRKCHPTADSFSAVASPKIDWDTKYFPLGLTQDNIITNPNWSHATQMINLALLKDDLSLNSLVGWSSSYFEIGTLLGTNDRTDETVRFLAFQRSCANIHDESLISESDFISGTPTMQLSVSQQIIEVSTTITSCSAETITAEKTEH